MADVCGGLHAAHELQGADGDSLGVVHRDVSPQNVLVNTRGVAKLIDFGIAKARDRIAGDTNSETLKGKVQYMAPEQALGRPIDRRADVWAVGAVLFHLLSGKPPFETENEIQTLFVLSSGRPAPPLRGDVHPAVAAVVRRALSHAPAARYATALEMQHALEEAIVQAGLVTSSATVAAYLAEHTGDRSEKRKEAISARPQGRRGPRPVRAADAVEHRAAPDRGVELRDGDSFARAVRGDEPQRVRRDEPELCERQDSGFGRGVDPSARGSPRRALRPRRRRGRSRGRRARHRGAAGGSEPNHVGVVEAGAPGRGGASTPCARDRPHSARRFVRAGRGSVRDRQCVFGAARNGSCAASSVTQARCRPRAASRPHRAEASGDAEACQPRPDQGERWFLGELSARHGSSQRSSPRARRTPILRRPTARPPAP